MYSKEEKILILGALFHDVGKFIQRCYKDLKFESHPKEGMKFIDENINIKNSFIKILASKENYDSFCGIILNHHKPKTKLEEIVQISDHISASERELLENKENLDEQWEHHFLSSVFCKVNLKSNIPVNTRYFNQKYLIKKNYKDLITESESYKNLLKYSPDDLKNFRNDLEQILSFYESDEDFSTIINLLLVLFEKYLWCLPDFTGNKETDISLFNHSKDVCGLSLAIFKSKENSRQLNLIIGDIPGIQDYIFDLHSTKGVAKILRGRSIFVQVLSRNFATKFLDKLKLTECNLIMLAGGKFYIVAQDTDDFNDNFNKVCNDIEKFLWENFNAEMTFNSAYTSFNYNDLKEKKISFGKIVEEANKKLIENRKKLFKSILFEKEKENDRIFIINKQYIEPEDNDANNIKCKLTNKPILEGQQEKLKDIGTIKRQVKSEFEIGDEIPDDNVVVAINEDGLTFKRVFPLDKFEGTKESQKILINPDLDKILEIINKKKTDKLNFLKNSRMIEVASYVQKNSEENKSGKEENPDDMDGKVMTFSKLAKQGEGVNYLAMIKGDIDNLGLIMALGFDKDENSLSGISRITTMSNHLKFFFSFYLNEFLRHNYPNTYTIFAGGDDLMLITPQSEAVNFVDSFNKKFNEFVCDNQEIHISYSITHFKDHTPIKLVNVFADANQESVKKGEKADLKENCFANENNKSSNWIFNTKLKNSELDDLICKTNLLAKWVKENDGNKNKGISMGVLRNLMRLVEILKEYREKNDTSKLIWHPMLTYMINRNLKSGDKYKDEDVGKFFEEVLTLNKEDKKLEKILYPAICGAIYKLRK